MYPIDYPFKIIFSQKQLLKSMLRYLLFYVFLLSSVYQAQATIYYVDNTPTAATDNGTKDHPWSLETAITNATVGDIVYILAGNYGAKALVFPNSGTATDSIFFIGCTTFPEGADIGRTDISIAAPLTSFEDFLNAEIEDTGATIMPMLNGNYTLDRAIDITRRRYLVIQNFIVTNYVEGGIQGENDCGHLVLRNVVVTNIGSNVPDGETRECGLPNGELDEETNEPFCGYGIELYGDSCLIESCIVVNAGAHNISVWRGIGNRISNCKSYGNRKATNGSDYYILVNEGNFNIVENCVIEREDGLTHRGHGIGTTHGSFNRFINCSVKNTREGLYVRGAAHYNTFENCMILEDYGEGVRGKFEAIQIRDGASYNQFINCKIINPAIAVRMLGSSIIGIYENKIAGLGTGHHNLFFNCLFEKAFTFIELRNYRTQDCNQLNSCTTCEGFYDSSLCTDCTNQPTTCLAPQGYEEGGNLFVHCNFIGIPSVSGGIPEKLIKTNQIAQTSNKIINSIFYNIQYFRTAMDDTPLPNNGCDASTLIDDFFDFENCIYGETGTLNLFCFEQHTGLSENLAVLPKFYDVAKSYHLDCGSPCINAGVNPMTILQATFGDSLASNLPFFDYDNTIRPVNNTYDIGMYEFNVSDTPLQIMEDTLQPHYRNNARILTNGIILKEKTTTLISSESITLTSGFHAQPNSLFTAKIETCASINEFIDNISLNQNLTNPRNELAQTEIDFSVAPNPFQYETQFYVQLPRENQVAIHLYNQSGKRLKVVLAPQVLSVGQHQLNLSLTDLQNGLYYVILQTPQERVIQKIVCLKNR